MSQQKGLKTKGKPGLANGAVSLLFLVVIPKPLRSLVPRGEGLIPHAPKAL